MMSMYIVDAGLFPDEKKKVMSMDTAIFDILTNAGVRDRGIWIASVDEDGDRSIQLTTGEKVIIKVKAEALRDMSPDQFLHRLQQGGPTQKEALLERASYFMHHKPANGYTQNQRKQIMALRERFW
jgi:hypothetical protein